MAQIYSPLLGRLLRSLLLQCVILLGLVTTVVAQTYPAPKFYEGPWRVNAPANVTTRNLSSDGASFGPTNNEDLGSAQLRRMDAYVDVALQDAAGTGKTGYRVSFSIRATAPTSMLLSYRTVSLNEDDETVVATVPAAGPYAATTEATRYSIYLPSNATNVRFQRAEEGTPYLFLDAIEVSQQPEFEGFSPVSGVPGTEVTITGVHLDETSQVFFGAVAATLRSENILSDQIVVNVPTGAVNGLIRIITPYGEATSEMAFRVPEPEFADAEFTTEPAFSPTSAGPGDVVILNGRYFTGATGVQFNGVDAAFTFEEDSQDTRIRVTVPLTATSGPITVTTPAGTATSAPFTVLGPLITAQAAGEENEGLEFTPATGPVGTTVTIYGKYFLAATDVFFNNVSATFTRVSDNVITATVPLGASTGFIKVVSPADEDLTATEFALPVPAFATEGAQFEPTSAGPGMQIILFGTNLASASQVVFLGDENDADDDVAVTIARPLTGDSNTRLAVEVPSDAKTGLIRIDAAGLSGAIESVTSEQVFTFVAAPTIASVANTTEDVTPIEGFTYGLVGNEVAITGNNFETATKVTIGNATVARANTEGNIQGFTVNQEGTQIVFTIPATVTESTGVVKVNTLGGEATWNGTFDIILKPAITKVEPIRGPRGGKITLTGSNLKYVSEIVFLDDETADEDDASVTFTAPNASDAELTFRIPANAETGKLLVKNLADETETAVFTIVRNPEVLTMTPTEGAEGTAVTLTGYNFLNEVETGGGATTVSFVGENNTTIAAANLKITSDSTMTFNVPADAVTGVITVANSFGPDTSEEFFIYQLPTIASFAPARGIAGNQVEITGTNFYAQGMAVTFLGNENDEDDDVTVNIAPASVNVADQKLTVTVPGDAVTGKLMVTNLAGNSAPSTGIYEVVKTPEILSFTPDQGKAAAPATVVTISGWLLNQGVTAVDFNGARAAATYNTADGTLTVTVPTGAATGPLTLIVNGERGHTSKDIFRVIPEPSIYSFNPTSGVAGTEVTITGTNFEGITEILFNEAEVKDLTGIKLEPVVIDEVSYQQFTVNVPNDATTGPIKITARGGEVTSSTPFVVPVPAEITFNPSESYANQLVTISGRHFKNIESVTFNGVAADTTGITVVKNGETESFTIRAPFDAGVGPIAITTPAGTGTSAGNYTVIEPVITSTTLREGYADRTVITIEGTNFTKFWNKDLNEGAGGEDDARPIVEFRGLNANQRVAAVVQDGYSNTSVTVTVPANARTGGITVRSGSGISVPYQFEVLAPTVSAVNPTAVYAKERVTVTGTNYIDVISVSYGGVAIPLSDATGYKVINETTIEFVAPVMPANSNATLSITTKSGSVASSLLTVYKPVIASVVNERVYAGVSIVTITGTRFDEYYNGSVTRAVPTVTFAGAGNTRITASIQSATYSDTEAGTDVLVVPVPEGAVSGSVHITSGSGTGVSPNLTIIGAPTITSLNPTSSLVNNSLSIEGTNLDQAVSVTFLGRSDNTQDDLTITTGFTVNEAGTEITLNVPANAVAGKILVTTPRISDNTATSENVFRIVKAPVITSIDEKEQQALQTITLRGANLWDVYTNNPSGAIKVWFRGHGNGTAIPAPANEQIEIAATVKSYDLVNGDWVTVEVPRDAITGVIKVTNAAGSFTTATEFKVTSPVIVRFEKVDGSEITDANKARINETVLIRGYQLADLGTIKIGSQNVLSFKEIESDPTTAEMVIPKGARRSTVQLTSLGYTETSGKILEIAVPMIMITNDPVTLSFNVIAGQTSPSQTYTVSAKDLAFGEEQIDIAVTGANDFEIALSEEGPWEKRLIVVPQAGDNNGIISATRVYVRSNPDKDAKTDQSGTITNSAFDAATRFVTLSSIITPLPVELIAFNARKEGNGVLLTWATASELDNDYFEVQMTEDMKSEFKTVGKVKSKVGTSSIRQDYQFNHRGNFTGTRYYRLKQVDFDGTSDYSRVVAVSSSGADLTAGPKVYPNPITSDSKLAYNAETEGKLHVRVVNMSGTTVHNQSYDIEAGENTIMLNLNNNLPTGIYILMTEFNGKVQQVKLLKQ